MEAKTWNNTFCGWLSNYAKEARKGNHSQSSDQITGNQFLESSKGRAQSTKIEWYSGSISDSPKTRGEQAREIWEGRNSISCENQSDEEEIRREYAKVQDASVQENNRDPEKRRPLDQVQKLIQNKRTQKAAGNAPANLLCSEIEPVIVLAYQAAKCKRAWSNAIKSKSSFKQAAQPPQSETFGQ